MNTYDLLKVEVHPDRAAMGAAAARRASNILQETIAARGNARIILASAPSQNELLAGLTSSPDIDWSKVTIFHMDEYIGLTEHDVAAFRNYQRQHVLSRVHPAQFHGLRGESGDPIAECQRYSRLLAEAPIDMVCMGIGENGHIAFNCLSGNHLAHASTRGSLSRHRLGLAPAKMRPSKTRHRVASVSADAVWLAFHFST
ncbi:MAG: 6-phosphogluconolactonase [Terrimicrobiaceae bacterium]